MSTGPESISLPLAHRVARRLAAGGLVGASWYWRVARLLATVPPAGVVVLSDGTPIVHDPTDWTCRMSYEGTYEREILRLLPELLGDGDAMVDVGANVGILGARAARLVGESGRVVAVEPSPRCLEDLRRVVDGMSNVTIVEAALGPERGTVRLTGWDNPDHRGLGTAVDGHRAGADENWYEGAVAEVSGHRGSLCMVTLGGGGRVEASGSLCFKDAARTAGSRCRGPGAISRRSPACCTCWGRLAKRA